MKNVDPMTKRPMRTHDGDKDMPNVKKSKRVQNSTSGNPAAKRVKTAAGKAADFFGGVARYDSANAPVNSATANAKRAAASSAKPAASDDGKMQKVMKANKQFGSPKTGKVARY